MIGFVRYPSCGHEIGRMLLARRPLAVSYAMPSYSPAGRTQHLISDHHEKHWKILLFTYLPTFQWTPYEVKGNFYRESSFQDLSRWVKYGEIKISWEYATPQQIRP